MGVEASRGLSSAIQAASPQQLKDILAGINGEDRAKLVDALPPAVSHQFPRQVSEQSQESTPKGRTGSKGRVPMNRKVEDVEQLIGGNTPSRTMARPSNGSFGGRPVTPATRRKTKDHPSVTYPKSIVDRLTLPNKKPALAGGAVPSLIPNAITLYQLWSGGRFEDVFNTGSVLGEGGFGQVFIAELKTDGTKRAVKTMLKSSDKDVNAMQLNEVQTLISLDHPHIVNLFRYYESDTDIKLVFELCRGPDLLEKIINGPMSERTAAVALRHMLKALKYCHDMYFGHYDVKPENFMYSGLSETNLKMIDFGFSGGFMRGDGKVRGTISYMAPEVVQGTLGPEADVWSCGAVLFAMLTTWEFTDLDPEGDSNELMKILKVRFKDRRWANARLQEAAEEKQFPADARDLLAKMLIHDRHMRPSVLEALAHPFVKNTYAKPVHNDEIEMQARAVLDGLVESIRAFARQPLLKRSALLVMSHAVSCGDGIAKAQRVAYRKLDKVGSGDLSMDSLESGMLMNNLTIPSDLDDLFACIDIDSDGYICFVDFLSATLPISIQYDQTRCEETFGVLDFNKDGTIDTSDLTRAFRYDEDDAAATTLCGNAIIEAGFSCGFLSCEEFMKFMRDDLSKPA